jgi:uncharacterized protein YfaP (DUF2135 family)
MRARLILVLALLCAGAAARADEAHKAVRLDSPAGGWNVFGLVDHSGELAAAYPTPPVERGRQKNRTLIRGRLAAGGAPGTLAKLIVNGNAMPLYGNPDGTFARPYVFGKGSNSIEVRSADGKARTRVQFFEGSAVRVQPRIRIICSWDDSHAEVDMHVVTPDGQHAFWAQPVLSNGGGLDVDSVDGAGPEMFSMTAPMHGMYHVYINYWGNFNAAGYNFDADRHERVIISTQITLLFDENTPHERRETIIVPLRRIGDLTLVKSFAY